MQPTLHLKSMLFEKKKKKKKVKGSNAQLQMTDLVPVTVNGIPDERRKEDVMADDDSCSVGLYL